MGNEWIDYVKAYAKDHNLKYNEALKEAGKSYKEMKGKVNKTNNKIKGNGLKANKAYSRELDESRARDCHSKAIIQLSLKYQKASST